MKINEQDICIKGFEALAAAMAAMFAQADTWEDSDIGYMMDCINGGTAGNVV